MSSPFFIQSYLPSPPENPGDLVINIFAQADHDDPHTTTALDLCLKGASPALDLWEFAAADEEGFYLLQNPETGLVITIAKPPVPYTGMLDAEPVQMIGSPPLESNAPNQIWEFVPSAVAGYYFIQSFQGNLQVIDIHHNLPVTGGLLDVFTKKTTSPDWGNQLWRFIDEEGNSVTPPPLFTPPPPPK